MRTPNPARQANGTLLSASCAAATACTAVGSSYNGAGITTTLAETWNGTRWAARVTPNPVGAAWSRLYAVSCGTPWTYIATGYYVSRAGTPLPLAERWNGAQWSIQATPSPAGARASGLFAVSCRTPDSCAAVGEYNTSQGIPETLAERWNGAQWSVQATPDPAGAQASGLFGVSCPASRACTATGSFISSSGSTMSLAERWNGLDWAIQAIASPAGATSSLLVAVSCTSPQACTAVGSSSGNSGAAGTLPLAEAWNGIQWVIQAAPSPGDSTGGGFSGLACGTAHCTAAGSYSPGTGQPGIPLAEGWNGTRWSIEHPPRREGAVFSEFAAVSCPAPRACRAVGASATAPGQIGTLAEGWNGARWRIQPIPNPSGALISMLAAVSCATARACIAVGSYTSSSGATVAFAERWNGATWQVQAIPTPAGVSGSGLAAVSCVTPQACTAVGSYTKGSGSPKLLAERWNGTTWQAQPTPTPPGFTGPLGQPSLSAVSCPTASGCTATGNYTRGDVPAFFIEAWNGTHWRLRTAPTPPGTTSGALGGVSCRQTGCTAAGGYTGLTGVAVTLALTTTP